MKKITNLPRHECKSDGWQQSFTFQVINTEFGESCKWFVASVSPTCNFKDLVAQNIDILNIKYSRFIYKCNISVYNSSGTLK